MTVRLPVLCVIHCGCLAGAFAHSASAQISPIPADESRPGTGLLGAVEQAERRFDAGEFQRARSICDQALEETLSIRVRHRLQGLAIRCCLALQDREQAVQRAEQIYRRDPASEYLALIPLVWDERVPEEERYAATKDDLVSASPVRQLAAASVLLSDEPSADECVRILRGIQSQRGSPLSWLAQAQLWRHQELGDEPVSAGVIHSWKKRVDRFPAAVRGGPYYVVGRGLRVRHEPDAAALCLLWAPLMAADDPVLAAGGLSEAILCLEAVGRLRSAARLRAELRSRYSASLAARRVLEQEPLSEQSSGVTVAEEE